MPTNLAQKNFCSMNQAVIAVRSSDNKLQMGAHFPLPLFPFDPSFGDLSNAAVFAGVRTVLSATVIGAVGVTVVVATVSVAAVVVPTVIVATVVVSTDGMFEGGGCLVF